MRLANFGRKPLDFTLKLFYGNSVVGVGTYTVEPWQYTFVSELVTLNNTETTGKLGLTVELDSTGEEETKSACFSLKIEMDKGNTIRYNRRKNITILRAKTWQIHDLFTQGILIQIVTILEITFGVDN